MASRMEISFKKKAEEGNRGRKSTATKLRGTHGKIDHDAHGSTPRCFYAC